MGLRRPIAGASASASAVSASASEPVWTQRCCGPQRAGGMSEGAEPPSIARLRLLTDQPVEGCEHQRHAMRVCMHWIASENVVVIQLKARCEEHGVTSNECNVPFAAPPAALSSRERRTRHAHGAEPVAEYFSGCVPARAGRFYRP